MWMSWPSRRDQGGRTRWISRFYERYVYECKDCVNGSGRDVMHVSVPALDGSQHPGLWMYVQ